MAYFDNTFFAGEHFKAPFYGGAYFQLDYFADMPIAHGQTAGTTSATTIVIVANKDITGTFTAAEFVVMVDGTANVVTDASATDANLTLTVTDSILTTEEIRVSYPGEATNNFGILKHDVVVNNEV